MTPAEVRRLAEADPQYAGFVGDGASVPWEVFPPPYSCVLWAYKAHLDNLCPECFKLHDFLYSPLATYLPVTKEDADLTLLAELLPLSSIDANVVYSAVRIGGAHYYQRTPVPVPIVHNMGVATPEVLPMARFKITTLFQIGTNRSGGANPAITRVAGWSESIYGAAASVSAIDNFLQNGFPPAPGYLPSRAALLPRGGSIVGYRVQSIPVVGASVTFSRTYPGATSWDTDIPSMGLLFTILPAGSNKVRRVTIRGIPDIMVTEGEFEPTTAYMNALRTYWESLRTWEIRGRDPAATAIPIQTISGVGLLTVIGANPFVAGQYVQVTGAQDAIGVKRSGVFRLIPNLPSLTEFLLQGWPYGLSSGGQVRANDFSFDTIGAGEFAVSRIVQRKVGRPFVGFRGRRSKKRARA